MVKVRLLLLLLLLLAVVGVSAGKALLLITLVGISDPVGVCRERQQVYAHHIKRYTYIHVRIYLCIINIRTCTWSSTHPDAQHLH
jgi:hypothetical protein